jgi:hypothetical protein
MSTTGYNPKHLRLLFYTLFFRVRVRVRVRPNPLFYTLFFTA